MNTFQAMARDGRIKPGDILLFKNGERGILNGGIRYAQRRALRDLDPLLARVSLVNLAAYTHAAQVVEVTGVDVQFAEQCSPHARFRWASQIPDGQVVRIRRLRGATPERLQFVLAHWRGVVARREPYPVRELFYYWFRWVRKTALAQRFAEVFRDSRHNVCSGEVVCASQYGGWFRGEPPEAWYPARLALDCLWTEPVDSVTVQPKAKGRQA
jgi:hypothetical protein